MNNDEVLKNALSEIHFNEFPFKTTFSLRPLIEFWERECEQPNKLRSSLAGKVIEYAKKAPELYEPITDMQLMEKYKETVDLLMVMVYPPSQWNIQIATSSIPFKFKSFYKTPAYERIFPKDDYLKTQDLGINPQAMYRSKVVNAYLGILNKFYNIEAKSNRPVVIRLKDTHSPVNKYYQMNFDITFTRINCIGTLPELSPQDIKSLLKDPYNLDNWNTLLPPENFEFEGFVTYSAIDVTTQEAISALKFDLLEKESIISMERFKSLEDKMKSLFELPDLRLGLASLPKDWSLFTDYARKIGESFLISETSNIPCESFTDSIYHAAEREKRTIVIEDIENHEPVTIIEKELLMQGIRSILIAPLLYKNEVIGMLELGSPNPGDINGLNWVKIKSVLPLFATAVKRSMEEFDTQIQAVIKEKCTAIHPSVEWRFRRAAVNLIFKREKDSSAEMEDIFFENVYPLYGLSDIRNSSEYRNESIVNDLVKHLELTGEIINSAYKIKRLPVLSELVYNINKQKQLLEIGLNSGDEISVLDFIQNDIEPVFDHLRKFNPETDDLVTQYYKMLDPDLHTFYSSRKHYEESVALINDTLSRYLDDCELISQEMLPHYFEKYKTDGVEHGMYIGASLLPNKEFDRIYLKNLRLWQLMMLCGIVRKAEDLKSQLKIPLETTHLVLVQDKPLSIKFRADEKKFDVDGTYNLRYEIMKKRIDKVLIKRTNERLTQPGKVAVIYSQAKESAEYRRYLEYLDSIGYIKDNVEELELEDLQGIYGLQALRFSVNLKTIATEEPADFKEIQDFTYKMEDALA